MQLTDKIFKGLYRRGVMLEQMKEPALSRTVKQMEPAEPCENPRDIDALSPEEILRAAEEADIVDETDGRWRKSCGRPWAAALCCSSMP